MDGWWIITEERPWALGQMRAPDGILKCLLGGEKASWCMGSEPGEKGAPHYLVMRREQCVRS